MTSLVETPQRPAGGPFDPGQHIVQFYDQDDYLVDVAASFLATGIARDEPLILIAAEPHRTAFHQRLAAEGFDVDDLQQQGRLTSLDARETLDTFMNGTMPDPARFKAKVGAIVARSAAGRQRVRAYGEMVDLLWRDGNSKGAIRLEELWNDLAEAYPFSLLCAYPMANFYRSNDAEAFERICHAHGTVVPAESYAKHDETERVREITRLQQRAAALEAEVEQRRKLEEALREALEENATLYRAALDANRAKDEFLATLSHELRTPLTAILGWTRMIRSNDVDRETFDKAMETIERSARTQASLVDDILDLSRAVTGKFALHMTPVDVRAAVDSAMAMVTVAAEARQIEIVLRKPAHPVFVIGDMLRLEQTVWNLLTNAIKFSPRGGVVTVDVEMTVASVRIRVHDSGIGIDPEFLPHVFEPFRQADSSSSRSYSGLGLGLALVKHFTELHGGAVSVSSDGPGQGATFTVDLPPASNPRRE